jgi:hypothetical protein
MLACLWVPCDSVGFFHRFATVQWLFLRSVFAGAGVAHLGSPNLHHETRSALIFVGFFVSFLALIAVAGLGGWWFMKHIARDPFAHRHAAMTRATTLF